MCPQIQALFRGRDTGLFTAAAHLLGIVRENVTNKQFWDAVEKLSQISIPAHLRRSRRVPCCCQGGRSGDVTAAGKQEFPPQHFPSQLQHLSPIFISNSPPPHALLLTHSPHFSLLYFYLKLFPQISVVAPRTVNLIRGGICFRGNISPCFFTGGKYNTKIEYCRICTHLWCEIQVIIL